MEQRYGTSDAVQKGLQEQRERCRAWGSLGLHDAYRETVRLLEVWTSAVPFGETSAGRGAFVCL